VVQNNFIGMDASATHVLPNVNGIWLKGSDNLIGGGAVGEGNLIAGNLSAGCYITLATSANNRVYGNEIAYNHGTGVTINQGAHDNSIGDTFTGAPVNNISFNNTDGVSCVDGLGNLLNQGNSITGNGGLGIDLADGANNNQDAPVLDSAVIDGGQTAVGGSLIGTANSTFVIRFFANPANSPEQGAQFIGYTIVTTDSNVHAYFTMTFGMDLTGQTITATATDVSNNTSEFSNAASALPPGFSYSLATKVLTLTGSNFVFTQSTTASGGALHTDYTFTIDGYAATLPDSMLSRVVANGASPSNVATLVTNDTYFGTDFLTHETAEAITLGNGGGKVQKLDSQNVAHDFLSLNNFQTVYATAGTADAGAILSTPGVKNVFVGAGSYAYMNSGNLAQDFNYIHGAKGVYGYASGPGDFAYEYDGSGASSYLASGTAYSSMTGTDGGASFFNEGIGFTTNFGIAQHPGQDTATFYDSPNNDVFVGNTTSSYMYSSSDGVNLTEYDYVQGFSQVSASSFVGGTDYAYDYDPSVNQVSGFTRLV
jgi:hypothetical protein